MGSLDQGHALMKAPPLWHDLLDLAFARASAVPFELVYTGYEMCITKMRAEEDRESEAVERSW